MHIYYEVTKSDFVSASKLAANAICRGGRYLTFIYPLIGLLWIFIVVIQADSTGTVITTWTLVLPAFFFFFVPALISYQRARLYRKLPLLQGRHSLDISDENLYFLSPKSEATLSWDNYDQAVENKHSFVLILQGSSQFQIIPKRELSVLQIDELRTILQAHLTCK
jgi:hypothetical protein